MEYDLKEMLKINEAQKLYYEATEPVRKAPVSKYWAKFRSDYHKAASDFGIYEDLYNLHWDWMGDLRPKYVLDLGCHTGNPISVAIAQKSAGYLGIDLSESAIQEFSKKLRGLNQAKVMAVDFLSEDFQNANKNKFDLIYAHSVAHHFKHFEQFLKVLKNCLKADGIVITYDPLQTSYSSNLARHLYRPFQPDKAWEFPFTKSTFPAIREFFEIEHLQGFFGRAKWAIPIYLVHNKMGRKVGRKFHQYDLKRSKELNRKFWHSMHVSMCWRLKYA